MAGEYTIVLKSGTAQITEKKSRFISHVQPVRNEAEAIAYVEKIKKEYWDARHNCYAFVIGKNNELMRFSDDGEPGGTAGKPILEVLTGNDIHDAVIVVTRYFGGVLLGTGGLVRAYSMAARMGLDNAVKVTKRQGVSIDILTDYTGLGKIQYIMRQTGVFEHSIDYTDKVIVKAIVPSELFDMFNKKVTEATSGKASFENIKDVYYGNAQEDFIIFD
ncbi:MAG: YigZ family protein [Eubacterium sp.]